MLALKVIRRVALKKIVRMVCVALVLALSGAAGRAQPVPSPNTDVEQAVSRFLTAFNNLDWPAFRDCFSQSPTAFFPFPQVPRRVEGEEFDKDWQSFFDASRKQASERGRTTPPFLDIKPADTRIDRLTDEVAVVTFHLGAEPRLNRRTLILQKFGNGWKIVHLHASYLAPSP
jgi:ketosteroid isomerase-like protein